MANVYLSRFVLVNKFVYLESCSHAWQSYARPSSSATIVLSSKVIVWLDSFYHLDIDLFCM